MGFAEQNVEIDMSQSIWKVTNHSHNTGCYIELSIPNRNVPTIIPAAFSFALDPLYLGRSFSFSIFLLNTRANNIHKVTAIARKKETGIPISITFVASIGLCRIANILEIRHARVRPHIETMQIRINMEK